MRTCPAAPEISRSNSSDVPAHLSSVQQVDSNSHLFDGWRSRVRDMTAPPLLT